MQDSVGYESTYSHLNEWFSSVLVRVQDMQFSLPALAKGCWCRMLAGSKRSFSASWNMTSHLVRKSLTGAVSEDDMSDMNFSHTTFN